MVRTTQQDPATGEIHGNPRRRQDCNVKMLAPLFMLLVLTANTVDAAGGWYKDLNAAKDVAARTNRPILCHFGAVWCGPCQLMERKVFPNRQVQGQLGSTVVGVKIDVNRNPELAKRYNVTAFPTDLFLEPNGQEIIRTSGFKNVDEYVTLMGRAQTRYADLLLARSEQTKEKPDTDLAKDSTQPVAADPNLKPMLSGYCPVTLWKTRRWVTGSPRLHVTFQGQLYTFAGEQERQEFQLDPERYAPQFLGCDPVSIWETNRAVPGSAQFGAFYGEQLYLFASNKNRLEFKKSPDRYLQAKVVLDVDQIETQVQ